MLTKIMKVIFMNKLMMKFWYWRYDRRMAKFDWAKWEDSLSKENA